MFGISFIEFVLCAAGSLLIFLLLSFGYAIFRVVRDGRRRAAGPDPGYFKKGSYRWDPVCVQRAKDGPTKMYVITLPSDEVYYISTDAEHAALNLRDNDDCKCYVIQFKKGERLNEAWTHDSPEVLEINDYRSYLLS